MFYFLQPDAAAYVSISGDCEMLYNQALGGGVAFIPDAGAVPDFLLRFDAINNNITTTTTESAASDSDIETGIGSNFATGWGDVYATENFTIALEPRHARVRTGAPLRAFVMIRDGYGQARWGQGPAPDPGTFCFPISALFFRAEDSPPLRQVSPLRHVCSELS